jgi:hypothetical protein
MVLVRHLDHHAAMDQLIEELLQPGHLLADLGVGSLGVLDITNRDLQWNDH